jgi:hypothetical protein
MEKCPRCERVLGEGGCVGDRDCLSFLAAEHRRWGPLRRTGPMGLKVGLDMLFARNDELSEVVARLEAEAKEQRDRVASAESRAERFSEALTSLLSYCVEQEEILASRTDKEARAKVDVLRAVALVVVKVRQGERNIHNERNCLRELERAADELRRYLVEIACIDPGFRLVGSYDKAKKKVMAARTEIDMHADDVVGSPSPQHST